MDIYQIKVREYNLIFSEESEYTGKVDDNNIFTNTYIYGDDTIVEVINKIKLAIIDSNKFEYKKFDELYGYLSSDKWNYYSDYKIQEYEKLVNNNNPINNTFYKRINLNNHKEFINPNNLVIGYYARNNHNNYKYYINNTYFEELIINNNLLENEYNNPINTYKIYNEDYTNNTITSFVFNINEEEHFKKFNKFNILNSKNTDKNIVDLKSIYEKIQYSKKYIKDNNKLPTKIDLEDNNIFNLKINKLSLQIHSININKNLLELFENFTLNENCPVCIYSYKDKKKHKKYKILKKDNIPVINLEDLKNIHKQSKKTILNNNILFKIKFSNINYYFDVYILDEHYFYINFDFTTINNITNFTLDNIIININNVLEMFNLYVGDSDNISSLEQFFYFNNNNYIKFVNSNSHESININYTINLNYLGVQNDKYIIHNFINYIILFHTNFELTKESNQNFKMFNKNTQKTSNVSLINDKGIQFEEDQKNLKEFNQYIVDKQKIYFSYKKSYNYESYNYVVKFLREIMTNHTPNAMQKAILNFSPNTIEKIYTFLEYGTYEDDASYNNIDNTRLDLFKTFLNLYGYDNIDKRIYYRGNAHSHQKNKLFVEGNILYFNISNIYSLNEFNNFENIILEFIYFNNLITNKLKDPSIIIPLIDNSENIYMSDKSFEYKNIYNNIYNLHNNLIKLPNIQYYMYIYFNKYYKNISNKKLTKDTKTQNATIQPKSKSKSTKTKKSSKKVVKSKSTDENPENIGYKDLFDYKHYYCTQGNVELYKNYFGKDYISLCEKPKRPSIIPAENLKQIQKDEQEDKIKLTDKTVIKYFSKKIDLNENIININIEDSKINIDKKDINKLVLGRLYIFNIIINNPIYKFVLLNLFKLSDEYIIYDNIIQEPSILEIYKNEDEIYTRITFDDYLLSKDKYFKFHFHYNHSTTTFIDNIIIGYLYETTVGYFPLDNKSIKKFQLNAENNSPKKYYYDLDRYKDNYFICLPNDTTIGRQLDNDKYDVLYKQGENDTGGLCCGSEPFHELQKLDDNYKKNVYNNKKNLNENNFTVKHLKIATIPTNIYIKLCSFLNITQDEHYSNNEDILFNQPYRIGFNTHKNIPHFMTCLLDIYKYSTPKDKKIKTKYPEIFSSKYYDKSYILKMLKQELNSLIKDKNSDNFLKQLNEGMYINISEDTTPQELIDNFNKYITDNFSDLDLYLIWSLFSRLLNINIVIIEIEIASFINSYIKCPNNNQFFHELFKPNNDTCFILKLNNIFQPIIFQTKESIPHYTLLFDIENYSDNFRYMYSKCLLKYNDIDYNNALINSVYHGVDFMNYIVLFAEDFEKIKPYVDAIVVNDHFIKLGLIIQFPLDKPTKKRLFLPINSNKHEIHYSSLFDLNEEKKQNSTDLRYMYLSSVKKNDSIITTIDKTIDKFNEFYKIHNIDKLKLDKDLITYITDEGVIIGIALPTNDIIPVRVPYPVTDIELTEDNQLYTLDEYNKITDVKYNDFNYDKILYKYFIKYVSSKLSSEEVKSELEILLNELKNLEKDKHDAEDTLFTKLKDFLKSLINIDEEEDEEEDEKLSENINMCHTITSKDKCINNCKFDKEICKYQIQRKKYELFLDRLIYDLVYNDYKKNLILNNLLSDSVTTFTDDTHIFLDDTYINDYTFNSLYNKTSIDNFFHILGINHNLNTQSYINDYIYCSQEKTIMTHDKSERIYYQFKSVLRNNDVAYSNCIYYNLGKYVLEIKDSIVKTLRKDIAKQIANLIESGELNFYEVIQTYLHENKTHIYNNIDMNELNKLIQTDNHWLTLLDLYIISKLYNKEFHIYTYDKIKKYVDTTQGFIVGNGDKVELFMTHFYYKQIFYLIKN